MVSRLDIWRSTSKNLFVRQWSTAERAFGMYTICRTFCSCETWVVCKYSLQRILLGKWLFHGSHVFEQLWVCKCPYNATILSLHMCQRGYPFITTLTISCRSSAAFEECLDIQARFARTKFVPLALYWFLPLSRCHTSSVLFVLWFDSRRPCNRSGLM